jgi:hypothetical protein
MIAVINFIENSVKESAKRMDEPYLAGGRRKPSVPASAAASGQGSLRDDAARKQSVAALPAQLFGERLTDNESTRRRAGAGNSNLHAMRMPVGRTTFPGAAANGSFTRELRGSANRLTSLGGCWIGHVFVLQLFGQRSGSGPMLRNRAPMHHDGAHREASRARTSAAHDGCAQGLEAMHAKENFR